MFTVSIPNAQRMINKLVTQDLKPWASEVFRDSVREVNWCKLHPHIMFGLHASYKNFDKFQVNMHVHVVLLEVLTAYTCTDSPLLCGK